MNATALDANQANAVDVRVALGDLVGDPRQATLDRIGVEYGFSVRHSVGWGHKKNEPQPILPARNLKRCPVVLLMPLRNLSGSH